MERKPVVLVTGGSGLVGRNLKDVVVGNCVKDKDFVFLSSKDANLEIYDEVNEIFEKYHPDYVINLAANVGGLYKNMLKNLQILKSNMHINQNVIDCANKYKVKKCISCLSTCIFPDNTTYPIDESMVHNGPPSDTNYGYSYAKRFVDIYNRAYNDFQSHTLFTSVVPCNIYGPYDNFNLEDAHVIPALIHKAYIAKEKNEPFIVYGTGSPLRQFIYATDLARLILLVLDEYDSPEPIILSTDESDEITIGRAAECIRQEFSIQHPLEFNPIFADGQFKKTASNAKLRKLWPNFTFVQVQKGIAETVSWFQKNYATARK